MKTFLRALAAVVACIITLLIGGTALSVLTTTTGFKFHHLGALLGTVAAWGYGIFLLWSVRKVWRLVNGSPKETSQWNQIEEAAKQSNAKLRAAVYEEQTTSNDRHV